MQGDEWPVERPQCDESEAAVVMGWLHVWDVPAALESRIWVGGQTPIPQWQLCVLHRGARVMRLVELEEESPSPLFSYLYDQHPRHRLKTRRSRSTDTALRDTISPAHVKLCRLDGGRLHFERRWGYSPDGSVQRLQVRAKMQKATHDPKLKAKLLFFLGRSPDLPKYRMMQTTIDQEAKHFKYESSLD